VFLGFKYKADTLADSLLNKNIVVFRQITKQSKITDISLCILLSFVGSLYAEKSQKKETTYSKAFVTRRRP